MKPELHFIRYGTTNGDIFINMESIAAIIPAGPGVKIILNNGQGFQMSEDTWDKLYEAQIKARVNWGG